MAVRKTTWSKNGGHMATMRQAEMRAHVCNRCAATVPTLKLMGYWAGKPRECVNCHKSCELGVVIGPGSQLAMFGKDAAR